MENTSEKSKHVGEMVKRREKMTDEKRYIIYYTFDEKPNLSQETSDNGAQENNV